NCCVRKPNRATAATAGGTQRQVAHTRTRAAAPSVKPQASSATNHHPRSLSTTFSVAVAAMMLANSATLTFQFETGRWGCSGGTTHPVPIDDCQPGALRSIPRAHGDAGPASVAQRHGDGVIFWHHQERHRQLVTAAARCEKID